MPAILRVHIVVFKLYILLSGVSRLIIIRLMLSLYLCVKKTVQLTLIMIRTESLSYTPKISRNWSLIDNTVYGNMYASIRCSDGDLIQTTLYSIGAVHVIRSCTVQCTYYVVSSAQYMLIYTG